MKVDRTKLKRSSTEVPPECKSVIEKIKSTKNAGELNQLLAGIESWTFGKCELYHWIDVLDIFDSYLEEATKNVPGSKWAIELDSKDNIALRSCVSRILSFTTLLVEHSFSRHLYNSMDHLVKVLNSCTMRLVLDAVYLLYMFSKRSNFLTRLPEEKRDIILERLTYIADSWGGKEAGFGLAACCQDLPITSFPSSAKSVHMEFSNSYTGMESYKGVPSTNTIHFDDVTTLGVNPAALMDVVVQQYSIPEEKQNLLFTHLRLAYHFSDFASRCQLVQARLLALSVLVYTNALHDNFQQLLYSGLMEEFVEVLELEDPRLTEIKSAGLRALTSVIHLDRAQNFPSIIDVTGIGSYHGFLPIMVRNCISSMIASSGPNPPKPYPTSLATALFSFIYHLASYELGGEALVNCGMLESLLKVVTWEPTVEDQITFVTRAVRVIDLITNMDMQGFHTHGGLTIFINRLETEVAACRAEQPYEIISDACKITRRNTSDSEEQDLVVDEVQEMDTDSLVGRFPASSITNEVNSISARASSSAPMLSTLESNCSNSNSNSASNFVPVTSGSSFTKVCLPQRAALLKSLLNFLKKVIQDASFSDTIRHVMETSLPNSLRHIISNAEYYGSSLFLLATDVVTVYVFQEPSLLSTLQDSGLTDVVQQAILLKNVPATREVIASIPNIFSALCLNSRGLNAFLMCKPFHKICKLLISPQYLSAMRRRRSAEPMGDTATNLGNSMDELMRHQPGLKAEATAALVKLLEDLCQMSNDVKDSCWKDQTQSTDGNLSSARGGTSEVGSSEEDDDDEEPSISSQPQGNQGTTMNNREGTANDTVNSSGFQEGKPAPPMVDYIFNVMKFLDAILSNNSTDDHCREFVAQQGIKPLISIFSLRNLPLDFPNTASCQAVSTVCKSIICLAREGKVLEVGMSELDKALGLVEPLGNAIPHPGSSVLLHEIAVAKYESDESIVPGENPSETPILSGMTTVHSLVMMFIQLCRTGQPDIRSMSTEEWGGELGVKVLKKLSKLYLNLVWESTVLLAICSGEYKPGIGEFARADLDIIVPLTEDKDNVQETVASAKSGNGDQMDIDLQDEGSTSYLNATRVSSATQTNVLSKSDKTNTMLQEYAKILKPVLSASSRLGRALAELFGLLVKLAIGSQLRQRRGVPLSSQVYVSPWADNIAGVLSKLLTNGLRWEPIPTSPIPKLQLNICAVGFSSPLLFDEKRFPYHLMLKKFVDADGLAALFDVFYWVMEAKKMGDGTENSGLSTLSEQKVEFLESWLALVERFVDPKSVFETPHTLPPKNGLVPKRVLFNPAAFLGHIHKLAFKAVLYLWNRKSGKLIGGRSTELMLMILCSILRYREQVEKPSDNGRSRYTRDHSTMTESRLSSERRPNSSGIGIMDLLRDDRTGALSRIPPRFLFDALRNDPTRIHVDGRGQLSMLPPALHNLPPQGDLMPPFPEVQDLLRQQRQETSSNITASGSGTLTSQPGTSSGATLSRTNEASTGEGDAPVPVTVPSTTPQSTTQESSSFNESTSTTNNVASDSPVATDANTTTTTRHVTLSSSMIESARALGISLEELQQLVDMGFAPNSCIEALIATTDIVQATEYLINNPNGTNDGFSGLSSVFGTSQRSSAGGRTRTSDWPLSHVQQSSSTSELRERDDDMFRALMMSIDDDKMKKQEENFKYETLSGEEIDDFTTDVVEKCLELVEEVPVSIYRICELLIAVGTRKGQEWMLDTMKELLKGVMKAKTFVFTPYDAEMDFAAYSSNPMHTPLCIRILLLSLMFEELKASCFNIIESSMLIPSMVNMIKNFQRMILAAERQGITLEAPKWVAPTFLLFDLYEKAATATRRRARLTEETAHLWKWYDINSGKWCTYSTINNFVIDQAFWDGESSVRISAGRRRYVINFNGMVQLNEETSNRRPIALWLKPDDKKGPKSLKLLCKVQKEAQSEDNTMATEDEEVSGSSSSVVPPPAKYITTYPFAIAAPEEDRKEPVNANSETFYDGDYLYGFKEMTLLHGLEEEDCIVLLLACVDLMRIQVDTDTIHAVMRLCLRLTRNFEYATHFVNFGGITALLNLTTTHHFNGFLALSNLIIRHCMEDKACLKFAIEKMIREKVCTPCAATCKELHYLLRVLAPVACRSPELFVEVAKEVLRVDIPFVTRRGMLAEEDKRLIVKPVPSKTENYKIHSDTTECAAREVINKLLNALIEHYDDEDDESIKRNNHQNSKCARSSGTHSQAQGSASVNSSGGGPITIASATASLARNELIDPFEQMDLDARSDPSTSENNSTAAGKSAKTDPSEKIKNSKPLIPKYVILQLLAEAVHSYSYASKIIAEFALPGGTVKNVPEDCTALSFLLDRLGPVNQFLGSKDSNTILRDLLSGMAGCNHLPDAQTIVITEVKTALNRLLNRKESQEKHLKIQYLLNLISYMIETCPHSVMTQYVPVKLPHVTTFNNVVRLLIKKNVVMDLARVVHYVDLTSKYIAQTINAALKCLELISRVVNLPPQAFTMKPRNKPESTQHDSDNNTHTIATSNSEATRAQGEDTVEDAENTEHDISAAAESLDPISESHTQDPVEHDEEAFEEIMDHLLERENAVHSDEVNEGQNSLMDTSNSAEQRRSEVYERDHDSDSSISSGSSTDDDDDDVDGDDDEDDDHNEGVEDEDEEDEDEADEEDGISNFEDNGDEERLLRGSGIDRDDDMFMVQYGVSDDNGPIFFTNNATYNYNLGLFEETLMNDQSSVGLRLNHPLLQPPSQDTQVHSVSRSHRTGRQRRYQYFQYINPRHPPPPALLQRLLGPATAQEVIQLTTGQTLNHQAFRDARLLVMEGSGDQNLNRGGNGSSGTLSNFTALHWWCEESKVLDGESMHDCVVGIKREIINAVEKDRDEAFQARREKKNEEASKKEGETNATKTDEENITMAAEDPILIGAPEPDGSDSEEDEEDVPPIMLEHFEQETPASESNVAANGDTASTVEDLERAYPRIASFFRASSNDDAGTMDNSVTQPSNVASEDQATTTSSNPQPILNEAGDNSYETELSYIPGYGNIVQIGTLDTSTIRRGGRGVNSNSEIYSVPREMVAAFNITHTPTRKTITISIKYYNTRMINLNATSI